MTWLLASTRLPPVWQQDDRGWPALAYLLTSPAAHSAWRTTAMKASVTAFAGCGANRPYFGVTPQGVYGGWSRANGFQACTSSLKFWNKSNASHSIDRMFDSQPSRDVSYGDGVFHHQDIEA